MIASVTGTPTVTVPARAAAGASISASLADDVVYDEYRPQKGIVDSWQTVTRPASVISDPAPGQVARSTDELLRVRVTFRSGATLLWDKESNGVSVFDATSKIAVFPGVRMTVARDSGPSSPSSVMLHGEQLEQAIRGDGETSVVEKLNGKYSGSTCYIQPSCSTVTVGKSGYAVYDGQTVASEGFTRRKAVLTDGGGVKVARDGSMAVIRPFVPASLLKAPVVLAEQEATRLESGIAEFDKALAGPRNERIVFHRQLENAGYTERTLREDLHADTVVAGAACGAVLAVSIIASSMLLGYGTLGGALEVGACGAIAGAVVGRVLSWRNRDGQARQALSAERENLQQALEKNRALVDPQPQPQLKPAAPTA